MSRPPTIAMLERVSLFKGLDQDALQDVLDAATLVDVPKGGRFFDQGDEACAFYVLVWGRVKLLQLTPEGQQVVVRFLGPGELMGCKSLFGGQNYPGTTEAVEETRALKWDGETSGALMARHGQMAMNAMRTIGHRFNDAMNRNTEIATERVERRIARALLRLVRQAGRRTDEGVLIEFPLSRQDVAEMTGTTLYTVSRIMSGWEKQDLVELGRQRVVIKNPHGLVSIAEDLG